MKELRVVAASTEPRRSYWMEGDEIDPEMVLDRTSTSSNNSWATEDANVSVIRQVLEQNVKRKIYSEKEVKEGAMANSFFIAGRGGETNVHEVSR